MAVEIKSLFVEESMGWSKPIQKIPLALALRKLGMTDQQVKFVMSTKEAGRVNPPQVLREMRLLSAERIASAMALNEGAYWLSWVKANDVDMQSAIERVDLSSKESALRGLVCEEDAVPLRVDKGAGGDRMTVYYLISSPVKMNDIKLKLEQRADFSGAKLEFVFGTPKTLSMLYYRNFVKARELALRAIEEASAAGDANKRRRAFGYLLIEAVYYGGGVENIYFEPGPVAGQMFIQVEGVRVPLHSLPLQRTEQGAIDGVYGWIINQVSRDIKALDGAISSPGGLRDLIPPELQGRYDFRVELKETVYGPAAVLRPFDLQADVADLELLGFDTYTFSRLRRAIESPFGLIIIVGPTSSGKNTSAIAMLYSTDPLKRSIQTVEHPVEVRVGSWMQHEIPMSLTDPVEVEGKTRTIIGSLLRSAPQVIYWGECRTADALSQAITVASTGHLTLTTYHGTDIASALLRIRTEAMRSGDKINMATAGDAIIGILSQRLMRKICKSCSVPEDREGVLDLLRKRTLDTGLARRANPEGCEHCGHSGYIGRVLAYEWMEPPEEMDLGVATGVEIREHVKPGLYESGIHRIAEGLTDFAEVHRVLRQRGQEDTAVGEAFGGPPSSRETLPEAAPTQVTEGVEP